MLLFLALQAESTSPIDILSRISLTGILYALLTVGGAYLLVRLSDRLIEALSRQTPRARFFFKLLAPMVRFALWIGASFIVLAVFSPTRETLLAVLASLGIALGLGSQDLVKNIFGGLIVLVDRPDQLGDRVRVEDAYGEIDHIGLTSTKLTTPDDTRVTIPNSHMLNKTAWNANSGVPECQVVTDLYLPPDCDPVEVAEIGSEAAYSSPFLSASKPVVVLLKDNFEHAPYLTLRVKGYVYDHRFEPRLQSDITLRAKSEFVKRGLLKGWRQVAAKSKMKSGLDSAGA